jgi:hypothetical protein
VKGPIAEVASGLNIRLIVDTAPGKAMFVTQEVDVKK